MIWFKVWGRTQARFAFVSKCLIDDQLWLLAREQHEKIDPCYCFHGSSWSEISCGRSRVCKRWWIIQNGRLILLIVLTILNLYCDILLIVYWVWHLTPLVWKNRDNKVFTWQWPTEYKRTGVPSFGLHRQTSPFFPLYLSQQRNVNFPNSAWKYSHEKMYSDHLQQMST